MSYIIFFILGFLVSTFTLLQVFIILFFGIPTAKAVNKLGYLKKENKIIRNYCISLAIISIIYIIVLLVIKSFFPNEVVPFLFGIIPMLFLGIPKIGRNKGNVTDFTDTNKDDFTVHQWEVVKALLPHEAAAHEQKLS